MSSGPSPSPEPTLHVANGASGSQGDNLGVDSGAFGDVRQSQGAGRFRKMIGRLQPTKSSTDSRRADGGDYGSTRTRELSRKRSNGTLLALLWALRGAEARAVEELALCTARCWRPRSPDRCLQNILYNFVCVFVGVATHTDADAYSQADTATEESDGRHLVASSTSQSRTPAPKHVSWKPTESGRSPLLHGASCPTAAAAFTNASPESPTSTRARAADPVAIPALEVTYSV